MAKTTKQMSKIYLSGSGVIDLQNDENISNLHEAYKRIIRYNAEVVNLDLNLKLKYYEHNKEDYDYTNIKVKITDVLRNKHARNTIIQVFEAFLNKETEKIVRFFGKFEIDSSNKIKITLDNEYTPIYTLEEYLKAKKKGFENDEIIHNALHIYRIDQNEIEKIIPNISEDIPNSSIKFRYIDFLNLTVYETPKNIGKKLQEYQKLYIRTNYTFKENKHVPIICFSEPEDIKKDYKFNMSSTEEIELKWDRMYTL